MIRVLACPDMPVGIVDVKPFAGELTTDTHCIWCGRPLVEHEQVKFTSGCWDPRTLR